RCRGGERIHHLQRRRGGPAIRLLPSDSGSRSGEAIGRARLRQELQRPRFRSHGQGWLVGWNAGSHHSCHHPIPDLSAAQHLSGARMPRIARRRPPVPFFLSVARALAICVALVATAVLTPNGAHAQKPIPSPESVFGFPIGKDSNLVDYEQSIDYFRKLAAA